MGIIRNTFRKLLDSELGVVGVEQTRLEDRLEVFDLECQALRARLDLLVNRTGTRLTRLEKAEARGVGGYAATSRKRDPGDSANDIVWDDPFFHQ
jgi:hypothetical protein